jgi:hypothetical protein
MPQTTQSRAPKANPAKEHAIATAKHQLVAELRSTSSCLVLVVACSFFAGAGSLAGLGACAKLSIERTSNAVRATPIRLIICFIVVALSVAKN